SDSAGNLYGTATLGGDSDLGTVFFLDRSKGYALFRLHSFSGSDGAYPNAPLTYDEQTRTLYGTTSDGGSGGTGIVFRISMPSVAPIQPSSGPAAGGTALSLAGGGPPDGETLKVGGVAATGVVVADEAHMTAVAPALTAGTLNDVVATNPQ